MKHTKKLILLLLAMVMLFTSVNVGATENSGISHEDMMEAYLDGRSMDTEIVAERKRIALKRGLTEHIDEKGFLTMDYQNKYQLGRSEPITDSELDVLVEMGTRDDELAILTKGMIMPLATARITSGQTVSVTQMARISGAGNGYFTISGASSYGYCAQNSKNFWSNNTSKSGVATEWNNAEVRKALYYGPGGPGYSGNYYGSTGADMDHVTFAVGQINGDTNNNTKATKYRNLISGKADPLSSGYRAFKVDIASPYQDVAFLAYVPTKGTLTIRKSSSNPTLTNGNSCYSLSGATYTVYNSSTLNSSSIVGTLTTNASGATDNLTLNAGTYYVQETKAPPGFARDSATKTVSITADRTTTLSVSNIPQMDPIGVLLGKVDAETNANKPEGSASLQGAYYTMKFYGVQLADKTADPGANGYTPLRTWVFETNENGFCYYDTDFKVSGDDLYLSPDGAQSLPLGTLTIQETKAPEGYLINPEIYVRQVTSAGDEASVETYNYPIVPEQILKLDLEKKNDAGTALEGATFSHKKPDGTIETFSTDDTGKISVKGLEYGTHEIWESKAPDGYRTALEVFQFTVLTDNTITDIKTLKDGEPVTGVFEYEITTDGNLSVVLVNQMRIKLPATGSAQTLIISAIGVLCCFIVQTIKSNKNRREKQR